METVWEGEEWRECERWRECGRVKDGESVGGCRVEGVWEVEG